MNRWLIFIFIVISDLSVAQKRRIKINNPPEKHEITIKQQNDFKVRLVKNQYYTIVVDQQGIDIVLSIKDKNNKKLIEKDSPNGTVGIEKITFSPDSSDTYTITIKPLKEKENSKKGLYTIQVATISDRLKKYSARQLNEDFEILKNAYIETHVGLWYNSFNQFENFCEKQKSMIKDSMTDLAFYKIIAPVTSFTKEGHCYVRPSDTTNDYLKQYGKYFPFFVKILNQKVYALNNFKNYQGKGQLISKINGIKADSILNLFVSIEPADGYNYTSKYHWIEQSFSYYFLRFFQNTKFFSVELTDPVTNKKQVYKNIPALGFKEYKKYRRNFFSENPELTFTKPSSVNIDSLNHNAVLTINTFRTSRYKDRKKGFKKYLDKIFTSLNKDQIENLIIDVRKNEGGEQGMEDILVSYLIRKKYHKYKYVELSSLDYSFLKYTDYKGEKDKLEKELSKDFYQDIDGRYLSKDNVYQDVSPSAIHFNGQVYILIDGLTFSGGSEFAALAKNYTNAVFIGEETGGGYYGNTSGDFLRFTLPNTKLTGRIPLRKYVLETPKHASNPFGRGLIPDYKIQPTIQDVINKKDAELTFAKKLILKKRHRLSKR